MGCQESLSCCCYLVLLELQNFDLERRQEQREVFFWIPLHPLSQSYLKRRFGVALHHEKPERDDSFRPQFHHLLWCFRYFLHAQKIYLHCVPRYCTWKTDMTQCNHGLQLDTRTFAFCRMSSYCIRSKVASRVLTWFHRPRPLNARSRSSASDKCDAMETSALDEVASMFSSAKILEFLAPGDIICGESLQRK
nr:hypothetical protein Iba_chr14dCG18060 [Ipomoea batatas]